MMMNTIESADWASDILRHCRVSSGARVFVLGCLESRRITFGAQQVRAFNLVHALYTSGELGRGTALCVVGAGAAGITTAHYAALLGARVTVADPNEEPMHQLAGSSRLLHPRLYEWPHDDDWNKEDVDLPLMNWSAKKASEVVAALRAEWKEACQLYGITVTRAKVTRVESEGRLRWQVGDGSEGELYRSFDLVILAPGFGEERQTPGTPPGAPRQSYWQPDNLATFAGEVLVCGNGDGALTDVLRARLREFDQESIATLLLNHVDQRLTREVEEIELRFEKACAALREGASPTEPKRPELTARGREALRELNRAYAALHAPALDDELRGMLRPETRVRLWVKITAPEGKSDLVLGSSSFPINRLLVTALLRVDRERVSVELGEGNLPAVCPGLVIYRAGLDKPAPVRDLGLDEEAIEALERVNQDATTGDRTRIPRWSTTDRERWTKRTSNAYVPRPWRNEDSAKRGVVQVYRSVGEWRVYSDHLDSVTQALVADSGTDVVGHYRALLRLYGLVYDKILVSDTQLYDGPFFVQVAASLDTAEWSFLRRKVVIVSRTGGADARRGFLKKTVGFRFSGLGLAARNAFDAWFAQQHDKQDDTLTTPEVILRRFADDDGAHATDVQSLCDAWARWDERLERAPAQLVRFNDIPFDIDVNLENPAAFVAGLGSAWAKDLARCVWGARANRGKAENELLAPARAHHNQDMRKAAYEVSGWFHRAYNRTIARKEGASAFDSIHVGRSPVEAEPAGSSQFGLDLSGLAKMPVEEYVALAQEVEPLMTRYRNTGELARKLDALSRVPESDKASPLRSTGDPIVDRVLHAIRPARVLLEWVGEREARPEREAKPGGASYATEQTVTSIGEASRVEIEAPRRRAK